MKIEKYINELPVDYANIGSLVYDAKRMILSGDYDLIEMEIKLKAMEELVKQLRADKEIKAAIISEAEKHGKSFDYMGAKISIREGGVKYDYAASGDSTWALLDVEEKEVKEKKKARENFLKSLPPEGAADVTTGEHIYPPVKTGEMTVAVTLGK